MKVPNMIVALEDYDRVLWVDADVVIHDSAQNIMDAVEPDAWQAVVEHETNCGVVPNCGVWVVTKQMGPWLEFAWSNMLAEYKDHPWWEQAAIMHMMGYKVTLTGGTPHSVAGEETDLLKRTQFLPPQWNDHPADIRRLDRAAFVHVTQYADRLDAIRRLCDTAT
jgi:hypothetical protein